MKIIRSIGISIFVQLIINIFWWCSFYAWVIRAEQLKDEKGWGFRVLKQAFIGLVTLGLWYTLIPGFHGYYISIGKELALYAAIFAAYPFAWLTTLPARWAFKDPIDGRFVGQKLW